MIDGVGKPKRINRNYQSGFGYIVIPADADRDKYIDNCYRKERVAVQLDFGGGIIKDCYILANALKDIKFPDKPDQLGSCVYFLGDEYRSSPVILGVLTKRDESQLLKENIVKHTVKSKDGSVNVEMDGANGKMFVNINSDFENGGSVFVNLNSKNNTAKFNVNCFGNIILYSEGDTSLETLKTANIQCSYIESGQKKLASKIHLSQDGILYEDRSNNQISINKDTIVIKGKEIDIKPTTKLKVFEGKSPMVKGDELLIQLEKMSLRVTGILAALTAAVATGNAPLQAYDAMIKAAIQPLVSEMEMFTNINSTKSFLD